MSKIKWTSLALLLMVIFDAIGDGFRIEGWQVAHHMMEVLQIMGWVAIWALFRFNFVYIVMYILARFAFFDLVINLIVGNPWWYVDSSSGYGLFFIWFSDLVKQPVSMMVSMPKLMAAVWWIGWFWTDRTFRELKTKLND